MTDPLDLLLETPDDELGQLLADLRWLVVRHPVATRSAARALMEEGRRFAETDEGRTWKRRLAGSELVRRGQVVAIISDQRLALEAQAGAGTVAAAEAAAERARADQARFQVLFDRGFLAQARMDQINAETRAAEAQLRAALEQAAGLRRGRVLVALLHCAHEGHEAPRPVVAAAVAQMGVAGEQVVDHHAVIQVLIPR